MEEERKIQWEELESRLGYKFNDQTLLFRAITHSSYANENKDVGGDNEKLEFLGDSVLGLVITHLVMEEFPHSSEGKLSQLRTSIINEEALARISREIDFGQYILLGKGEESSQGREKKSILADCLEAVLGAIYLDGGFGEVFNLVKTYFYPLIQEIKMNGFKKDYKSELQKYMQNMFREAPKYLLNNEIGPEHDKIFDVEVFFRNNVLARGVGKSKKEAEQKAAEEALKVITDSMIRIIDPNEQ